MQPQREIPVEEEPDEPPIDEYESNELKKTIQKIQKKYLSKTSSQGRQGGGAAVNMKHMIYI